MTIMSDRFLSEGRELTQQEYNDWTAARREEGVMSRFKNKPPVSFLVLVVVF